MSKLSKSLVVSMITFALGAPAFASADIKSDLDGVSVRVSYADLNLERQEGAEVLYRRLQRASKQACDDRIRRELGITRLAKARQCYRDTLTAAVNEIDNELLTQIHDG